MTKYQIWENAVNELMLAKHGVGIDDIPDMPWHDWFLTSMTANKAMKTAIDEVNKGGF